MAMLGKKVKAIKQGYPERSHGMTPRGTRAQRRAASYSDYYHRREDEDDENQEEKKKKRYNPETLKKRLQSRSY